MTGWSVSLLFPSNGNNQQKSANHNLWQFVHLAALSDLPAAERSPDERTGLSSECVGRCSEWKFSGANQTAIQDSKVPHSIVFFGAKKWG
jgi:hypothetical protein